MARADGSILIDTRIDTRGVNKGVAEIQTMFNKTISAAKKMGAAIAAAFAITKIVELARECIELGSSLDEVQNVVDVTFGNMSGVIDDWAKNAAEQFGLSELAAKQYASTIGAMFKSMGISGKEVSDMSMKMAELAADMASFYNLDTDTAFNKIRSGISGETEPLKQLGINMSEVNLEQFRMSQGMEKSYKQMNQQEKALLRYNYLLSVTSDAQGDFARTSNSWANQTRVLQLQLQSIKADLGKSLINVFTPVLQIVNKLLQGLAQLASAFKAFTNLLTGNKDDTTVNAAAGIGDVGDSYSEAADSAEDYSKATDKATKATQDAQKENKKYLSGLDQIRTYQQETAAAASAAAGGSTTPAKQSTAAQPVDFGSLSQGETVLDKTAQKLKALYDLILEKAEPAKQALKKLWDEGLQKLGGFVWQGLKDFYTEFLVPVGNWVLGEGIPRLVNAFNDGLNKINWTNINKALKEFFAALANREIKTGERLLWLWENVFVPFGTWVGNEVVPRFLKTLAAYLNAVETVLSKAKPGFDWFWENVLQPIAKWTGGIFLKAWDTIITGLEKFTDWCEKNPKVIENITVAVLAFFSAFAVMSLISGLGSLLSAIVGFASAAIAAINPVTLAIAAIVAIGVLVVKNWDTIKAAAGKAWGAIKKSITDTWNDLTSSAKKSWGIIANNIRVSWNEVKTTAANTWNKITTGLKNIWNGLTTTVSNTWKSITSTISGAWNSVKTGAVTAWESIKTTLSTAWENLKTGVGTTFSNIGKTIKDGLTAPALSNTWSAITSKLQGVFSKIQSAAQTMRDKVRGAFVAIFTNLVNIVRVPINSVFGVINGLIRGLVNAINGLVGMINKLSFRVPSWVPGIGGQKFGFNVPKIYQYPQIPYLAQGAVIPPNAPFAAVLGDQKHGTNIEAPLDMIKQAVAEVAGSGEIRNIIMLDGKVVYDNVMKRARRQQMTSGSNPFALA